MVHTMFGVGIAGAILLVFALLLRWASRKQVEKDSEIAKARRILDFAEDLDEAEAAVLTTGCRNPNVILRKIARQSLSIFPLIGYKSVAYQLKSGSVWGYHVPVDYGFTETRSLIIREDDGELIIVFPGQSHLISTDIWKPADVLAAIAGIVAPYRLKAEDLLGLQRLQPAVVKDAVGQ